MATKWGARAPVPYRFAVPRPAADDLVAPPAEGRVFETSRLVRFGDLSPGGRLRLDAVARYLQDVSGDDTADAGYADLTPWVVRRLVIEVRADAVFREPLTLCTWCSGLGGRWAERRVSIAGAHGAGIEAAVLWVHIDPETGAPRKLGDDFAVHYAAAAGGRKVSARLHHDPTVPADAARRPWPLRFTDFDPLRHANNAIALAIVEDELARRPGPRTPRRVEVEYRAGIEADAELAVASLHRPDGSLALWVLDERDATRYATAVVTPA
jgi:acyl-ACP thioesterase